MTPPAESAGGWTFGRVLGLILGIIGMVGSGFIGLCGAFLAAVMNRPVAIIIAWLGGGLILTILSILLVRSMNRLADKPRRVAGD